MFGVPVQPKRIVKPFRIWPMLCVNILAFRFEGLSSFLFSFFNHGTSWGEKSLNPADLAWAFFKVNRISHSRHFPS